MSEKLLFSRMETAQLLDLSLRVIDMAIADGTLAVKRVGRRVLVPRSSLERFAQISEPMRLKATSGAVCEQP
jgi:excisionase family DNA binding protein